ncbi:MAG: polyprenyl synthetase family protein [Thermoanaerobaculia bacterium]
MTIAAPRGAFEELSARCRSRLEEALRAGLPSVPAGAEALGRALSEAVLSPGKRVRPLAAIAAGRIARAPEDASMTVAVAVEYVHAASLVLDDLPSMDDARRRRGRPALHVSHGVAVAELAAVALLARAFELIAGSPKIPVAVRARLAEEFARAVGAEGSCAGQAADLAADAPRLGLEGLEAIHARKTGALFVAAVRGGALAGGAGERTLESLTLYARNLGLAFQITDDLLDLEGDPERLGKDTGRDAHRANFAKLLGAPASRALVAELVESAIAALSPLRARAAALEDLARVVRDRRT